MLSADLDVFPSASLHWSVDLDDPWQQNPCIMYRLSYRQSLDVMNFQAPASHGHGIDEHSYVETLTRSGYTSGSCGD